MFIASAVLGTWFIAYCDSRAYLLNDLFDCSTTKDVCYKSPLFEGASFTEYHFLKAQQILSSVPLVDGHNDLAWHVFLDFDGRMEGWDLRNNMWNYFKHRPDNPSQTDIPRMKQGLLGAQLWSAYTNCSSQYRDAVVKGLRAVDLIRRFTHKYRDFFQFVTTADGIMDAFNNGKLASMIGLEGGHMIDSSMAILRVYYEMGVRYMTITWNCVTPWADSCLCTVHNTSVHHGLSPFGMRIVREMNRLGMLVDISHVALETMYDVLNVTLSPVIFSHSNAYALCPHRRNAPDDVLMLLKENGGIIMVNVYPDFINCTSENVYDRSYNRTASISQVADHLDHIKSVTGPDHIGIGADFDGMDHVGEMKDVSTYPYLFAELLSRGWSRIDLEKLAFYNFHRVFKTAEQVRDSLIDTDPDDTLIDKNDISDKTCLSEHWNE